MAIQHHDPSFLLDALYCEEDGVAHVSEEEEEQESSSSSSSNNGGTRSFFPLLLEQDLFREDDELLSLFSNEEDEFLTVSRREVHREARRQAVEWMLSVNARHGFTALTAVLSVNYLDRFLSSFSLPSDKPWLIQLVAVTCLSLAAKVEETHVPLLLDLQVDGTRYVFEAKTVQRMELLVLSTLQWKMHPITPFSFLDQIITRLRLNTHFHREFLDRCERLLLRVISDSRSVLYLPSALATATMMHVIGYQNQLLGVLKISKDKVNDCYKLILDVSTGHENLNNACNNNSSAPHYKQKRKLGTSPSSSPSGVIDADFSSDSSNEAWVVGPPPLPPLLPSPEPPFKRRAQEQGMRL